MTKQEQDARIIKIMDKTIEQIVTCNEWHDLEVLTSENAMKKIKSILKEYDQDLNNLFEEITETIKEKQNDK